MNKFFKKQKPKKAKRTVNRSIDNINVSVKIIHTGRVLTIDDVNKNRSSKYSYLVFDL